MSRIRVVRAPWTLLALMVLALFVAACGETQEDQAANGGGSGQGETSENGTAANPEAEIKEGLSIVSMPKQLGNPYEEIEHGGVEKAVEEFGGSHELVGPTDASASSQVPLINSTIQKSPDAIIIAGNDPNAVAPALKNAAKRDIDVVAMDSDVAKDARTIFINQASSEEIGRSQVQILAEQIDNEGQIAILSATANATNQNAWIKFMKDELEKPEYSKMELVKVAYGDDDDQKSFQETQGLIQAYPDLKGIISPTTVGISAAARYLSDSPQKGEIALTGLGTPNQMRKFVKDGTVTEFALWNPEDVGYLAAYAAASLASGIITGDEGETFEAGDLGEREIGKDGEVILGPPTRFNRENIDDFDF